ncbi:MAG: UDP-N-acetylglucosamine--N-acetylmuramyl-(pentapeptide) pyrophosphoryl-undecaprenol N-acetylglucosamine transferase [Synergistaceae bacterium]|nr:UDP-N-acetylglucosamine--N-acetylmuramyl-(pentapeptide) pyrophosphoryl-undecaprenol N-acetylglucosamine transferase [Synergistaceae bacterium]
MEVAGKVWIAAGGTGGHIFPALAFGRWITENKKAERVVYLSGNRPLEAEIYASQGIVPYCLPLAGSPLGSSSLAGRLGRWAGLLSSFFRVGRLLARGRPDVCFLFGSYVSLAPLLWCRLLRIPTVIHEQNACAGKVTRLAARLGAHVASGWAECRNIGAFVYVGIPIRPMKKISRKEAATALGVDAGEENLVIGVAGGSLSSVSLASLAGRVARIDSPRTPKMVVVVLGGSPPDAAPDSFGSRVRFVGRRWDMTPFYSLCNVVVCRAGASTLAELAALGIPSLAVPWKNAADGHQEANARCFAALTGNPIWDEEDEPALDAALMQLLDFSCSRAESAETIKENSPNEALWQRASSSSPTTHGFQKSV